MKACVKERSEIKPEDYDLAQIEKGICKLSMDRTQKSLEMQVWRLGLDYSTTLEDLGYSTFIATQPKLAIGHILKRITHDQLRKRMKLTLKIRKDELKDDYQSFMRETAKETIVLDRNDAARAFEESDSDSDIDMKRADSRSGRLQGSGSRKNRKNKQKSGAGSSTKNNSSFEGQKNTPSDDSNSKKRWRPDCLNPKCTEKHFLNECTTTSDVDKKRLLAAYRESKKSKGTIGQLSSLELRDHSSLFSASFCDGAVETVVMADQGSDANVLPPDTLELILKAKPNAKVIALDRTVYYDTVDKSASSLPCSRKVKANVLLGIRHGTNLSLRGMEWLVSDKPVDHALISRHVLCALGLDNRVLLAAATERFKGSVDVPELLERQTAKDSVRQETPLATNDGSIHSLLQSRNVEFGSTFHSHGGTEEDKLEDSDIYVDLGEDTPKELEAALAARVDQARENGLSEEGSVKLAALLQKHKKVFA